MGLFRKIAKAFSHSNNEFTSAIILCAGASTRFEDGNKQMAMINDKCVAERTIEVFQNANSISEIVLVAPKESAEEFKNLIFTAGLSKVKCIVTGGETRQSSAMRGFKHISEKAKFVAIHDGARCLVTEDIINEVVSEAQVYGAAVASSVVTDTIKKIDKDGFIVSTIDRDTLRAVQTPQVFAVDIYDISVQKAKRRNYQVTDDSMMVEKAGFKVKLVDTGKENMKITVSTDIFIAESIIKNRVEENV